MSAERFPAARAEMPDISADLIAGRRFAQTWRGFDPEEVKEFLSQVAEQVRTLRERLDIEVSARREADQRAMHPRIDEATLMSAVGEETAAILRSARTAAAEIIAKAEANADAVVGAAEGKSAELLAQSEALSTRRAEEAEVAANELWAKALADAEDVRQSAQQDAEAIGEEAAQKCQESIEAAELARERILNDLARRRKLATVQIEQLRAGRERLLDAYLVVRRTLEDVTDELGRADAEARAAAIAVGRMERDEQTGELVDLRRDEHWDSLAAFGGPEVESHSGDQRNTAETPVVLAPKVSQVAVAPTPVPSLPAPAPAPATPVPAPATPAPTSGPAAAPAPAPLPAPTSGPAAAPAPSPSPAPTSGRAAAPAPAPLPTSAPAPVLLPKAPFPESRARPDDSTIVSRADAIESVRIVRTEPGSNGVAGPATVEEATEAKAGNTPPASAAVTEEAPAPAEVTGSEMEENTSELTGEAGQAKDVQGLFARLRENRDQATRAARKTLGDGEDDKAADATAPEQAKDEPEASGGEGPAAVAVSDVEPETAPGAASAAVTGTEEAQAEAPGAEPDWSVKLLERSDEVTRDVGSSLARKLKRALQDEQNSLLDRLRSMKGPITPAKVLPDPDEHPDHYADAGRPLLQQAARAGAQAAGGSGGHRAASADGVDQVDDLAEELGRAIAEPLRQRLELAMSSAGDDPTELADALGAAYREWKTQRIEASAHDEVAAAFARGAYLTFPDGSLLRWVVGPAEGPCPDCEDNALAGEQPKGEAWPTGQLYPPAHPGCRCVLAPPGPGGTAGP